ncbi:MAG: pyridinium-3,5-bisthiocarboxylic acid mononucleotide nickel chelatase, partial [Frankiaceae bacterium]|nr:pyridinium-3,5-bisthiocarboxylic acid mononucleotide nickel chelatase [Frankiaceae bacterium]
MSAPVSGPMSAPASADGWLDLSAGASGDMLLGALLGAGVDLAVLQDAVDPLGLPIRFRAEPVRRAGLAATKAHVDVPAETQRRTWSDVRGLLGRLTDPGLRDLSLQVFGALAEAEGAVHGIPAADVHFHEVGALDAVADVVGVCAGFRQLGLTRLVVSPVAVGTGAVATEHGLLPVPGPAVLELLRAGGVPTAASEVAHELCTPTGAALVAVLADGVGPMPPLRIAAIGTGAGGRDVPGRPNVVRLVVGEQAAAAGAADAAEPPAEPAVLLEANVDDLDPRVWPEVLATLLDGGAADAWLIPIVMKKGRPATTLAVLCAPE